MRTPLCKTFLRIALAIALLPTPALAAAVGRDRHKSDVEDVKKDIDNAKNGPRQRGKAEEGGEERREESGKGSGARRSGR